MSIGIAFVYLLMPLAWHATPVGGQQEWEETPMVQKIPGYHPAIRFNASSTYMFATTDFVQQGTYGVQNNHYVFRAVMANELENADIARLKADMNPGAAQKLAESYVRSMSNFEGDYDPSTDVLTVTYPVYGKMQSFQLYAYTSGDESLPATGSDSGVVGLWHAPEPYPDKLDARSRYKYFGLEGLQTFVHEATASDGAQFALLDLRVDGSFRSHSTIGSWTRNGSALQLKAAGKEKVLSISADGQKLVMGGKVVYERS
jgi:hypothetical protein